MLLRKDRKSARESDLVDLLLECHERIRRFVALARAAGEADNRAPEQVTDACASVERYFSEALLLHVRDEEESILPRLRGRSAEIDRALDAMTTEHVEHAPLLRLMLDACSAVRADPAAADRRRALVDAALQLERAFHAHLELEETVIFPAIRTELPDDVRADIVNELRARRAR